MESKKKKNLNKALTNLEKALAVYQQDETELHFITLTKTFETAVEYAWRELKRIVEDQGLEAVSPKLAVKEGAKLHLISEPEVWIACINARNNSVHDYFGISEKEYVELAKTLIQLIRQAKL